MHKEFDGNDLILHINDIRSNFTVDYSSQLSILYDAEKLKTAGVVEEVTGELSIIQSPWLFASSEMDYISYYSNSKKRYPAVKAILNYNTLRLLHNELNFSTKELEPSEIPLEEINSKFRTAIVSSVIYLSVLTTLILLIFASECFCVSRKYSINAPEGAIKFSFPPIP